MMIEVRAGGFCRGNSAKVETRFMENIDTVPVPQAHGGIPPDSDLLS
jgi:hypothetical protein